MEDFFRTPLIKMPKNERRRAEKLFYDLCDVLETLKGKRNAVTKIFAPAKPVKGNRYSFSNGAEEFEIKEMIGKGANGAVFNGMFGTKLKVAIKVNKPKKVALKTDAEEIAMQTRLYCHVRDHMSNSTRKIGHVSMATQVAKIPIPYFAVSMADKGRVIGMERVDENLRKYVISLKTEKERIVALKDAFTRLAKLLYFLQTELQFMHGDFHGENAMIRHSPYDVYLIDFGMSSLKLPDAEGRTITDTRYKRMKFNPYLDLLTLITSLREDLAMKGLLVSSRYCDQIISPFWDTVRAGLKGKRSHKYGTKHTIRTALGELSYSGEVYYAHHVLYQEAENIHYPACSPLGLLRALDKIDMNPPKPIGYRERIFEDFDQ